MTTAGESPSPPSFSSLFFPSEPPVHARNKRCVTLDMRRPEGQEIFLQLVDTADVLDRIDALIPTVPLAVGLVAFLGAKP